MRILKVVYLIFYKILIANLQENVWKLEGSMTSFAQEKNSQQAS